MHKERRERERDNILQNTRHCSFAQKEILDYWNTVSASTPQCLLEQMEECCEWSQEISWQFQDFFWAVCAPWSTTLSIFRSITKLSCLERLILTSEALLQMQRLEIPCLVSQSSVETLCTLSHSSTWPVISRHSENILQPCEIERKLWNENQVLFSGIHNVDRNILQRNLMQLFLGSWHRFFRASVSEKWVRETPDSRTGLRRALASKPTIRFYCTNREMSVNSSPLKVNTEKETFPHRLWSIHLVKGKRTSLEGSSCREKRKLFEVRLILGHCEISHASVYKHFWPCWTRNNRTTTRCFSLPLPSSSWIKVGSKNQQKRHKAPDYQGAAS